MPSLQDLKALAERATGIARPGSVTPRRRKAHAILFRDDGETPNNSRFPFLLYRSPVRLAGASDPAAVFEVLFESNGWKPDWRDGIYPYNHFHTGTHEVLGIAGGHARVRFGGEAGRVLEIRAGDVVVHPAGVGHRRLSGTADLLVVGAYPEGGRYDEPQPHDIDHDKAVANIAKVGIPKSDPVYGRDGPLRRLWRSRTS
jgi:uncharacterized protein YjlB